MNTQLKQRLIGIIILIIFLAIAIPLLMSGSKKPQPATSSAETAAAPATPPSTDDNDHNADTNKIPESKQPTIQFNTPEGKPIASVNQTATNSSGNSSDTLPGNDTSVDLNKASKTGLKNQSNKEPQNTNDKHSNEDANEPPVFKQDQATPSPASNIAANSSLQKKTIDDTTKAATPSTPTSTAATSTEDPELQQSIAQKEAAIVSNSPITATAATHRAKAHHKNKNAEDATDDNTDLKPAKTLQTKPTKPKPLTHKKKLKPVVTNTSTNANIDTQDSDLQRVLDQEKDELHKNNKAKTKSKNDDLVDPDI